MSELLLMRYLALSAPLLSGEGEQGSLCLNTKAPKAGFRLYSE